MEQIASLEKKMHDDEQQAEREAALPLAKKGIVSVVQPPGMNTHSNARNTDIQEMMQLHREQRVLSAKRVGQICTMLAMMKDLEERTYQTSVRLPFVLKLPQAVG